MELVGERKMIQVEETKDQAACSQSTFSRVGQGINFINLYQKNQHDWLLNGPYASTPAPDIGLDGIITFDHAFEITDLILIVGEINGSSGTTEIDIKWRPENTGAFVSIFSTTPKFTFAANPFDQIRKGQTVANMTAPIFSKSTFAAYDQLRMDIITKVAGPARGLSAKILLRPI